MPDERSTKARWQSIAETLAFVGIAVAIIWQGLLPRWAPAAQPASRALATAQPPRVDPPIPTEPVSLDGAGIEGVKTAKVALIEFSDFQCPFCGKFERETLPDIKSRYVTSGKVLLAFRQFPLSIHPFAQKAAEAATCAGEQGKFWDMHDQLFGHQLQLDEVSLRQYGKAVGLEAGSFDSCLAGPGAAQVKSDSLAGQSLKVSGTPTFFAGLIQADGRVKVVKRLSGAQPIAQFQAVLDGLIASVQPAEAK
jgi:protein-disulfide isomerase